ncbi:hypothetical protein HHK36_000652 [Tetracentron sinense]|uniref:Transmembrane protein n=1 Tax=Tetracentron sinense TaxID=13715 RepID=A0A835DU12_TETSI|nr:hypothetical protein HHK36_000652 [Tetracentron sinense]
MRKSRELLKGKTQMAGVLVFCYLLICGGIGGVFGSVVVHGGEDNGVLVRIVVGGFLVGVLVIVNLVGFLVQSVFYYVCKSYHHQGIDKSALHDHLGGYLGDYWESYRSHSSSSLFSPAAASFQPPIVAGERVLFSWKSTVRFILISSSSSSSPSYSISIEFNPSPPANSSSSRSSVNRRSSLALIRRLQLTDRFSQIAGTHLQRQSPSPVTSLILESSIFPGEFSVNLVDRHIRFNPLLAPAFVEQTSDNFHTSPVVFSIRRDSFPFHSPVSTLLRSSDIIVFFGQ